MLFTFFLTGTCLFSGVFSANLFSQCEITDMACVEKSVNSAMPALMAGIPELGVETSDPLFLRRVEGNLSILKYNFYNETVLGFKDCTISNLRINDDLTKVNCDLTCPKILSSGQYDISGRLVILPVEGSGDYILNTGKYVVNIDFELNKVKEADGKTYISIKNFKLKCTALEPIYFDFKNLFNGQKDLSDAVIKFANENWKEVADLVQDPIWYACIKKTASHVNKYLKHVPLEDFIHL